MDWHRLRPRYWAQNYSTDPHWDRVLNGLMDRYPVEKVEQHTCQIGGATVWIGNFPYAYGHLYAPATLLVLPTVATRLRLRRACIESVARLLMEAA